MLATAAGASPPDPQSSEIPLLAMQQLDDANKRSLLTQPVALTQKEKQWVEWFAKGQFIPLPQPVLTPREPEQLMHLTLHLKGHINKAKLVYQQALTEQKKQWEKRKKEMSQVEGQEWFKSLTPKQKEQWNKYAWQQEQASIHIQNEILENWGDNIIDITKSIMLDTDICDINQPYHQRSDCRALFPPPSPIPPGRIEMFDTDHLDTQKR